MSSHTSSQTKTESAAGSKTLKILLLATIVTALTESIGYSFYYVFRFHLGGLDGVMILLSLAALLLLLPLITFAAGWVISVKQQRIRWFFYGLALVSFQITVGAIQLRQLEKVMGPL